MSILVSFNGSTYIIPSPNEVGWGTNLDNYFVAIAAGALQKSGGSFTLSAEVDFGASFGLKSLYYKSRASNVASTGAIRLANAETGIVWRNAANDNNLALTVNGGNFLTFNGVPIGGSGIYAVSRAVVTDVSGNLATSATTATEIGYVSGVTSAIQTQLDSTVHLAGSETITGTKSFSAAIGIILQNQSQLIFDDAHNHAIRFQAPDTATNQTYDLPTDFPASSGMFMASTTGGVMSWTSTFLQNLISASSKGIVFTDNTTNTVTVKATNGTTSYTLSLPTNAGTNGFALTTDGSGNTTWTSAGSGTVSSGTQYQLGYYATSTNTITGNPHLTTNAANQLLVTDGTVGAPAISFTTQPASGIRYIGNGLALVGNGTDRISINSNGDVDLEPVNSLFISPLSPLSTNPGYITVQFGQGSMLFGGKFGTARETVLSNNYTVDASIVERYINTGAVQFYAQSTPGHHEFFADPSAAAGTAFTSTLRMRIANTGQVQITNTTDQLVLGAFGSPNVVISAPAPATTARTWTIPDLATAATFAALEAAQTFTGAKTFSGQLTASFSGSGGNPITGTNTNDSAAAGIIGQYIESVVSTFTNFPTSTQWGDLTSISLTAGDWDVTALMEAGLNGATITAVQLGISSTTGNSSTGLTRGTNLLDFREPTSQFDSCANIPVFRVSLGATTTYYLKYRASYSGGPPQAAGRLSARRVR